MMRHDTHRPSALRIVGLTTDEQWMPHCLGECDVLNGLRMLPHHSADDALAESLRLHKEAIHGPDEPGQLGAWQAGI